MNDMLKAGFSLMFFLLVGLPLLFLAIAIIGAYPWTLAVFFPIVGIALLASNKQ